MEIFVNTLKNNGAKLTTARKTVFANLCNSTKPLTLKEIHSKCNKIDFASVYRSIKLFSDLGLVEEITFADKKIRYELVTNLHHHHIICSQCEEIKEIPICLVSEIKKLTNYQITKHSFEFLGLCPKCQN